MDELARQINNHDKKLTKLETILERVGSNQDKMSDNIGAIAISIQKQELLLEKITNLEINTRSSFDRVHSRVNIAIDAELKRFEAVNLKLKILDPLVQLLKYRIIAITSLIGIYAMTIKEVRDPIVEVLFKVFM